LGNWPTGPGGSAAITVRVKTVSVKNNADAIRQTVKLRAGDFVMLYFPNNAGTVSRPQTPADSYLDHEQILP
jgi:NAD(P)H-flavin reductase